MGPRHRRRRRLGAADHLERLLGGQPVRALLHNGHTYLDISSYYLARFKTGAWPEIVRDTLYLTSRTQFAAADPTGGQSLLMSPRKGSAAPRDAVEVLSFLTAPATVRTDTGGARARTGPRAGSTHSC